MGLIGSFMRGVEEGRLEYQDRQKDVCDAPPRKGGASSMTPIKFGYYYDEKSGRVGDANDFYGERHVLMYGLNGAGKRTRFLIELLATAQGYSIVVLDFKGELAFQTAHIRRKFGKVKIICPFPVLGLKSDGYNCIAQLDPNSPLFFDRADAIADALIEQEEGSGQYFSESAMGLLTALIMWVVIVARREGRTPSLVEVRKLLCEPDQWEEFEDKKGKRQRRCIAGLSFTAAKMIEDGNPKIVSLIGRFVRVNGLDEIASIQSTADTQMKWVLSDYMAADCALNGTDFEDCQKEVTTIYIVLPVDEISRKRKWVRVLISCALTAHLKPGKVPKTLFILDEARAALGKLPIFSDFYSFVRGMGVQLMPIFQSVVQMKHLFKDEWENYAAQTGAVLTLGPPNDEESSEWMSKRCGVTTVLQSSYNEGGGVNAGRGNNSGNSTSKGGLSDSNGENFSLGDNKSGGLNVTQIECRAFSPQQLRDMQPGHGRIWLPGMGTKSIPFFAPNYWKRSAAWVKQVKASPLDKGKV